MFRDCHSGLCHSWSLCHLVNVRECLEIEKECFEIVKEYFEIVKECFEIVTLVLVTLWMWKSTNQLGQVRCRDTIATLFDKPWSVFSTFINKELAQFVLSGWQTMCSCAIFWNNSFFYDLRSNFCLVKLSINNMLLQKFDIVFHNQLGTFSIVVICSAQWPLTNQYIFKPCALPQILDFWAARNDRPRWCQTWRGEIFDCWLYLWLLLRWENHQLFENFSISKII